MQLIQIDRSNKSNLKVWNIEIKINFNKKIFLMFLTLYFYLLVKKVKNEILKNLQNKRICFINEVFCLYNDTNFCYKNKI